jgi:hypothetical protein
MLLSTSQPNIGPEPYVVSEMMRSGCGLDLSQFDAVPLIAFTATMEMNYRTNTDR